MKSETMKDKAVEYPLVSIVTPSYNQAQFIEETILSIQNQDYPNIEHIVVDGNSTDDTLDILKRYDGKIKWISEPDNGQTEAINKGFKMSNGQICAYLNSDDSYVPGSIKTVVDYFRKHLEVDMFVGDVNYIDENGKIITTTCYPPFNVGRMIRAGGSLISQTGVFFRRRLFDSIGMFEEGLHHGMDYDFYIRAGLKHNVKSISSVLANFRLHPDSKTMVQSNDQIAESLMIQKRYLTRKNTLFYMKRFFDRLIQLCFKILTILRTWFGTFHR
ncbi:glycosyltransferase family 2 protein [Candidatus Omnitrophota bacterium]